MDYETKVLRRYNAALKKDTTLTEPQVKGIVRVITQSGVHPDLDESVTFTDLHAAGIKPVGRIFI